MARYLPVLFAAPFLLALTGCEFEDMASAVNEKEEFHMTKPLKAGGHFRIENYNGPVEISGWERDEVDIAGTKYASTRSQLAEIRIDVQSSGDGVQIRTVPPVERRGNSGAKYVIRVPQRVLLDQVNSSNGSIRIERVDGATHVRTSNGGVRTRSLTGSLDVTTSNGTIEVSDLKGGALLATSNGSIKADNIRGMFQARTSNGSIDARLFDVPAGSPVKASTTNGRVELTLDVIKTDIRASTSNGSIQVNLPSNVNARIDANTSNSRILSDFEVKAGTSSKRRLEGVLGAGGPTIELTTNNGEIRVRKGVTI